MGKKEFDAFVSGITRQRIASVCLALGWNSVHQSSMEIMQDLLIRYIRMLGTGAQARAELCNRNQSNIMDFQRLFDDLDINIGELDEYVEKVDDRALITDQVACFPAPSKTDLNFLKPGSQEVLHRKSHIEQYFPPMYPELEKEEDETTGMAGVNETATGIKAESGSENNLSGNVSPSGLIVGGRTLTEKESELNPFREMDSVMMTAGGFISPAREGRLPDALRPAVSALAITSLQHDLDSATPPGTPTPPPTNKGSSNLNNTTPNSQRKRGPVLGSKQKRKKEPLISHKISNPDDSPDDLSGDETYEPPPGMADDSSSKARKVNKPRKSSPSKSADTLNSSRESISNHSEGHVDDIIQNVIERGIKESSRNEPSIKEPGIAQQKAGQNIAAKISPAAPMPSPRISRGERLPTQTQSPKTSLLSKQQNIPSTGPKKRGRKKKSELLKMEAEKAAQDASKSESSDVDICYDAPVRKKPKLASNSVTNVSQPPIELKLPKAPTLPPDASILFNNPLIPKVPYGFGDLSNFNVPTVMEEGEIPESPEMPATESISFDSIGSPVRGKGFVGTEERKSFPLDKHERKKEKLGKKSKKDKKDKEKSRDREKGKDREKFKDKKDKDKSKEKNKDRKEKNKELRREKKREEKERLREQRRERKREEKEKDKKDKKKKKLIKKVQMPPLFSSAEQALPIVQSQPSVPKIKIKDIKPDDKPKIVFKNVPGEHPGSSENQSNLSKIANLTKIPEPLDDYNNVNLHPKDKKQKSAKKKEKPIEIPYPQQVETLKLHKKIIKHEKRERISSGDTPKRKIKNIQPFSHGPSKPDIVDVDPGASSSSSPQVSGISSPSSFVGGGTITTQTVGKYVDQDGREIWICPGCGKQDDGSPMIGCDSCDDWYHWVCVNILREPADEDWFCPRCRARKSGAFLPTSNLPPGQQTSKRSFSASAGRRGRPPKPPKF